MTIPLFLTCWSCVKFCCFRSWNPCFMGTAIALQVNHCLSENGLWLEPIDWRYRFHMFGLFFRPKFQGISLENMLLMKFPLMTSSFQSDLRLRFCSSSLLFRMFFFARWKNKCNILYDIGFPRRCSMIFQLFILFSGCEGRGCVPIQW